MSSCHQQACLPGVAPWASCLMVAGPTFGSRSFHSATQFLPNLTTTPCLPPQNRRCFLTPYISSCTAEWFCCQIHCFRIPSELTSEFCALQQRPVEPRRCNLGEDAFAHNETKAINSCVGRGQSTFLVSSCTTAQPIRKDTTARSLRTYRSSSLCGAKAAQTRDLLITILALPILRWALPLEPHLVTPATIQALQQFQKHNDIGLYYSPSLCRRASSISY